MIATWFNSEARIDALQQAAQRWLGTPFFGNSCTAGPRGGVSCQKLPAAILREVGFWNVHPPEAAMTRAQFSRESLATPWLDSRPEFQRLPADQIRDPLTLLPGDVLCFRIHQIGHHLGLMTGPMRFLHAMQHIGTTFCSLNDPTYLQQLIAAWRPKPDEQIHWQFKHATRSATR